MKLIELAGSNSQWTKQQIMQDPELVRDIQSRLGITSDGIWGGHTEYAVADFCGDAHLNNASSGIFGATFAKTLLEYEKKNDLITLAQATAIFGRKPTPEQMKDLNRCLVRFEINTPARIRHFMAQISHESSGLKYMKELASGEAYEGRADLGNKFPGDGRRFKGAGCLQVTGRANFQALSDYLKDPRVMEGCDYVAVTYPFTASAHWWFRNSMNSLCDRGATVEQVTKRVNGGFNHLSERKRYYAIACKVIN